MEASVFWVDLGYKLRSQKRVPLQGSRGVIGTPSYSCLYVLYMLPDLLYMLPDYLAIRPDSAPGVWVVISDMYGTHLKHS